MSIKSILKLFVAFTLFSTPLLAEQVTVGASVEPIASLVVLGGNTNLDMDALINCAGTGSDASVSAAKFFINTNMPKWNVFIAFANGGEIKNNNDGLALVEAYLDFDTDLNVEDAAGTVLIAAPGDLVAATDIALTVDASLQNMQHKVIGSASTAGVVGNWFHATDVNTTGVDISLCASTATLADVPKLAGNYTEIIYLTLATSY